MPPKTVDLSLHINKNIERGHPADFPVALQPLSYTPPSASLTELPNRLAVVRQDTGAVLGIVSDRYTLLTHQDLLDVFERAISSIDAGPVPSGIYVDRNGARMRAIFKFPALARPIRSNDEICPCLQIANTYDGTSRIKVTVGAFRFVCTNLAVGGGGAFASGFVSVHVGVIEVEQVARQLTDYLSRFELIVETYRQWLEIPIQPDALPKLLAPLGKRHHDKILEMRTSAGNVYEVYNASTHYATHRTRSFRTAFRLLDQINQEFQKAFPTQAVPS